MPSLNKVQVIGNVGRECEMHFTPEGKPVTTFSVAANRSWTTPEGEKKNETEWFNISCWERLAEAVNQHVQKGMLVYVEGRLHARSWEGQDGQKHYRTEVVAKQVIFLSKAAERQQGQEGQEGQEGQAEQGNGVKRGDVPF